MRGCLVANTIRETVRQALDGFAERQLQRNRERHESSLACRIRNARYHGLLNSPEDCQRWLDEQGIRYRMQILYGLKVFRVEPGIVLPYRPDGTIDWESRHRIRQTKPPAAEQEALF